MSKFSPSAPQYTCGIFDTPCYPNPYISDPAKVPPAVAHPMVTVENVVFTASLLETFSLGMVKHATRHMASTQPMTRPRVCIQMQSTTVSVFTCSIVCTGARSIEAAVEGVYRVAAAILQDDISRGQSKSVSQLNSLSANASVTIADNDHRQRIQDDVKTALLGGTGDVDMDAITDNRGISVEEEEDDDDELLGNLASFLGKDMLMTKTKEGTYDETLLAAMEAISTSKNNPRMEAFLPSTAPTRYDGGGEGPFGRIGIIHAAHVQNIVGSARSGLAVKLPLMHEMVTKSEDSYTPRFPGLIVKGIERDRMMRLKTDKDVGFIKPATTMFASGSVNVTGNRRHADVYQGACLGMFYIYMTRRIIDKMYGEKLTLMVSNGVTAEEYRSVLAKRLGSPSEKNAFSAQRYQHQVKTEEEQEREDNDREHEDADLAAAGSSSGKMTVRDTGIAKMMDVADVRTVSQQTFALSNLIRSINLSPLPSMSGSMSSTGSPPISRTSSVSPLPSRSTTPTMSSLKRSTGGWTPEGKRFATPSPTGSVTDLSLTGSMPVRGVTPGSGFR